MLALLPASVVRVRGFRPEPISRQEHMNRSAINVRYVRATRVIQTALLVAFLPAGCKDMDPPTGPDTSIARVDVSAAATNLPLGDTVRAVAVARDANGQEVHSVSLKWASSDANVASVDAAGLVSALEAGSVTVMASAGGRTGSISITVAGIPVASVSVTPESATRESGDSIQLTAATLDASGNVLAGRHVTWASSTDSVVTVSATGMATFVASGSAIITATSEGVAGTAVLSVPSPVPVANVDVTPDTTVLEVDAQAGLSASVYDAAGAELSGRLVVWTSRDAAIAAVSTTGSVAAMSPGSTWVVATSEGVQDSAFVKVNVPFAVTGRSIAGGNLLSCALASSGDAYCWGIQQFVGDGTNLGEGTHVGATLVSGGHRFVEIDVGFDHAVAITEDGSAYAWGYAQSEPGVLGQGSAVDHLPVPSPVTGGHSFKAISTGVTHACAVTFDGDVYCWGKGDLGQLGNGQNFSSSVPVKVESGLNFVAVAVGMNNTAALAEDGQAWTWGGANYGEMGTGEDYVRSNVPVAVVGGLKFATIDVGGVHMVAVTADGTPYRWGILGMDTNTSVNIPTEVPGGHKFASVYSGWYHTFGLKSDGTLWAWGHNQGSPGQYFGGALGDGTAIDRLEPVEVAGSERFQQAAGGSYYSLGISLDGKGYGWGDNAAFRAFGPGYYHSVTPLGPTAPRMAFAIEPNAVSVLVGESVSATGVITRTPGGFTLAGPATVGEIAVSLSGQMSGVTVSAPTTVAAGTSAFDVAVTTTATATEATGKYDFVASAPGTESQAAFLNVTVSPPPPPGQEYACPSETTALPSGYHCMEYSGALTAGKFSDTELHGTWVDTDAGVCITWGSNGQGSARYNAYGTVTQTASGKWGAMINTDGSRYQNDRYWMVFTATADPQTNLLTYDSQTKTIVNWSFTKRSCPW